MRRKAREVEDQIGAALGASPATTHLEGRPVSPDALCARRARRRGLDGIRPLARRLKGFGPSRDPDARPETLVRYVGLETLVSLIRQSLKRSEAAVVGPSITPC